MTSPLLENCLARIAEREPVLRAWACLDAEGARRQAQAAPAGPLAGIPIGVKDTFDTAGLPTCFGTPIHADRIPQRDAACITRLRQAGAIILGKTVTTEYALAAAGPTTNPHDPAHTPGGSSSGSAAAVAAGMVPMALGTQTNASIIRPASYCGVVGFKPERGSIPTQGLLPAAPSLDNVGVFARTVEDAALLAQVLQGKGVAPLPPAGGMRLGFIRSPVWHHADTDVRDGLSGLAAALGAEEVELPPAFDDAIALHAIIMEKEVAQVLAADHAAHGDRMSEALRAMIARGAACTPQAYAAALDRAKDLAARLDDILGTFDAVLTPAATGEAPLFGPTTGSPVFSSLWSLCGVPALSLPLLKGRKGLPIGVQVVAARGREDRMLSCAAALMAARQAET
ncbi:amidase [Telmatospirillum sp. J64-1]|uniref:amidase n=1 Tax=Telmatospirillum sp. J64-1 TaxID=2502183 RepID=UPI00115CC824|nr:amidase [Telmatospirillum sp. J64-1]